MSDGARTRDILDHNQVLYQLSYTHQGGAAAYPPTREEPRQRRQSYLLGRGAHDLASAADPWSTTWSRAKARNSSLVCPGGSMKTACR